MSRPLSSAALKGASLHRPVAPFDARRLPVGAGHELHVEQVGDPAGLPAIFLHGGPGSGCNPDQRRYFDPARVRAVLFDQRGAGRSTPKRSLAANTTADLIVDMERIREALEIDRWMLVGGSWGATLAIAYAEAHSDRVLGIVLRSAFLGTREEFDWAFRGAARTLRPELWRSFAAPLPEPERADPVTAWGRRLESGDRSVRAEAAWMWHDYERTLSELTPSSESLRPRKPERISDDSLPNTPFLEWHYLSNDCFLAPGQLLRGAGKLKSIPGIVVQGRYDLLCPPGGAFDLAEAWGNAELRIVPGAGHAVTEPGVLPALVQAIADMETRCRPT